MYYCNILYNFFYYSTELENMTRGGGGVKCGLASLMDGLPSSLLFTAKKLPFLWIEPTEIKDPQKSTKTEIIMSHLILNFDLKYQNC